MKKNITFLLLSVMLSGLCALFVSRYYVLQNNPYPDGKSQTIYDNAGSECRNQLLLPDFTSAAENCVDGVVHVKVLKRNRVSREASILEFFFGPGQYSRERESVNAGSGVIVSDDGYIVTNNHVVDGGVEMVVVMNNNKSYSARLVGADAATDIALLKIDAVGLPVIPLGSSDSLRLGEWVLAIGNPFNLRSTITAGIVSAKGRSLQDAGGSYKIESFIQTDAAVNPGNSGGALINTKGELVGINTAIFSSTGSYAGYSFAVPTSIVKKVIEDIKNYGAVQRARLGVSMTEMTDKLAHSAGIVGNFSGVYIADVLRGSAAHNAGVKPGDVLVAIDGAVVNNPSGVQEKINGYMPGDEVTLSVIRMGERKELVVKLQQ